MAVLAEHHAESSLHACGHVTVATPGQSACGRVKGRGGRREGAGPE